MKMRGMLIVVGMFLFSLMPFIAHTDAQPNVEFPSSFSMTLPVLPNQQSPNQLLFNCPYSNRVEFRVARVYSLGFNGTAHQVEADVLYWTKNRECAGSWTLNLDLAPSLTSNALVSNFQTAVDSAFLVEANSNRQPASRGNVIASGN